MIDSGPLGCHDCRMRGGRIALAAAVALVLVPAGGASAAKQTELHCCWRVDVNASGSLHAVWENTGEPGGVNGTYDLSWDWEARELVAYDARRSALALDWIYKGNDPGKPYAVPHGKTRFHGSESSRQSRNDSNGQPVPFDPCRYEFDRPWLRHEIVRPAVALDRAGGETFLGMSAGLADEYEGACNNHVPFYTASSVFRTGILHRSSWDAFTASISARHTSPDLNRDKLKKTKDRVFTFEKSVDLPPPDETDDPRFDHTGTATARIVTRFSWFPYDRLQKQLNELDALG
jgi:hypothetical protein